LIKLIRRERGREEERERGREGERKRGREGERERLTMITLSEFLSSCLSY